MAPQLSCGTIENTLGWVGYNYKRSTLLRLLKDGWVKSGCARKHTNILERTRKKQDNIILDSCVKKFENTIKSLYIGYANMFSTPYTICSDIN